VDSIEIIWPSGDTTKLGRTKANQIISVQEGKGIIERPFPLVISR
jgi:hypothetical protein